MKYVISILTAIACTTLLFISCAKWKDPAPYTDPRLTNPYCNDPNAVNYNWGFPGKPDNTVCFYPTDLFVGTYIFTDSVYRTSDLSLFLSTVTETLYVSRLSQTQIAVTGFCANGNSIHLTADKSYNATVDTTVGDTLTARGQTLCRIVDTVSGAISKDRIVDSLLHISFIVVSDTGSTTHIGSAKKI